MEFMLYWSSTSSRASKSTASPVFASAEETIRAIRSLTGVESRQRWFSRAGTVAQRSFHPEWSASHGRRRRKGISSHKQDLPDATLLCFCLSLSRFPEWQFLANRDYQVAVAHRVGHELERFSVEF